MMASLGARLNRGLLRYPTHHPVLSSNNGYLDYLPLLLYIRSSESNILYRRTTPFDLSPTSPLRSEKVETMR